MAEGMNFTINLNKMPIARCFLLHSVIVDDLWTPFKQLYHQIQTFLVSNDKDVNLASFEALLRKNKQNFSSFLANPVSCCCFLLVKVLDLNDISYF